MMRAVATFVLASFLLPTGAEDMPTLNWVGRKDAVRADKNVVMKILREDKSLSYAGGPRFCAVAGTSGTVGTAGASGTAEASTNPSFDNVLVHGDNLEALKALLPFYAGKVKCIYIDPPYNTGSAFEHYDDNLEHSKWLNMMYPRLMMLKSFLSDDGSIWVNLDDNEVHYCKVVMDEIYGRQNFLCDVAWEKRYSPPADTKDFGYVHDHILVYRKSARFQRNLLPLTEDQKGRYKNPDDDPRGPWKAADYTCRFTAQQRPNLYYPIIHPVTGEKIWPIETRVWAHSKEEHDKNVLENRLWWGKDGKAKIPAKKNFLSDIQQGMMPMSLWHYELAGTNQDGKKENLKIFNNVPFGTPKPERLISIVLTIATNPGDLVMDSFLGSGTTAAVAQKMGRRWIGIEMGEHAKTHCAVRLKKVVDGEQGGISAAVGWLGGGGFKFYELGEPMLDGNGAISAGIEFDTLAAHIWWRETGSAWENQTGFTGSTGLEGGHPVNPVKSTALGVCKGVAYALLYNGVLHDRSVDGGNVLTAKTLRLIREDFGAAKYDRLVVYGECTKMGAAKLREENVEFRQTPYDIVTRR